MLLFKISKSIINIFLFSKANEKLAVNMLFPTPELPVILTILPLLFLIFSCVFILLKKALLFSLIYLSIFLLPINIFKI